MSAHWLSWLLAYLRGSVSGSLLVGRFRGVDIRSSGSGNAGATNALRTQGWKFALATALIDLGKGVLAALLVARLVWPGSAELAPLAAALACVFCAALGHCFPIWHGFRGGKGAGTLLGGLLTQLPLVSAGAFGVWLLLLFATGYVGLATVCAALSLPLIYWLMGGGGPALWICLLSSALVVWMHRSNLQRVWAGTEYCFERVRLLPRKRG